jgi:HEAT repeat protein
LIPAAAVLALVSLAIQRGAPTQQPQQQEEPDLRWTSWWEREREGLLDLRRNLFPVGAENGDVPPGFHPVDPETRRTRILPALLGALEDRVPVVRRAAAIALGKSGEPKVLAPLLRAAAEDDDRKVRQGAYLGLGILGAPEGVRFLGSILADERAERTDRSYAAAGLGLAGGTAAVEALRGCLEGAAKSENRDVRVLVALSLGTTGDVAAVPALLGRLRGPESDPVVRAACVLALGKIGDRSALPSLLEILSTDSAVVRAAVARALGAVAPEGDPSVLATLEKVVLDDPHFYTRGQALLSIGEIGGERGIAFLSRCFREDGPLSNEQTLLAYAAFALALGGSPDVGATLASAFRSREEIETREAIALAMGLLGDPSGAESLLGAIDPIGNPDLFSACAVALGLLRQAAAAAPLEREILRDRRPPVIRSAVLGRGLLGNARVFDALGERLRHEKSGAMLSAIAAALGDLGDGRGVDSLLELLARPRLVDAARAEVVGALGRVADRGRFPALYRFRRGTQSLVTTDTLEEIQEIP